MIPKEIQRGHILSAAGEIRQHGILAKGCTPHFHVLIDGRLYSSEYLISLASRQATGKEIDWSVFSDRDTSRNLLTRLGFKTFSRRDWSVRECYFAVWGYDQLDMDRKTRKSGLYEQLSRIIDRSPSAIEYKIQNVSFFDKRDRQEKPIAEASHAQKLLGEVCDWYWSNKIEARLWYAKFYQQAQFNTESEIGLFESTSSLNTSSSVVVEEGSPGYSFSSRRKWSAQLLRQGREHFKRDDREGLLRCQSCGFVTPKAIDKEIVQLHHREPISDVDEDGKPNDLGEAIKLLAPLCPTCHQISHISKPPLSISRIAELIVEK